MGPFSEGVAKKLGRVVGVAYAGGEGSGCCPRAGVIARAGGGRAVFAKGAYDILEIPAIRRFREGLRLCAKSAEGMYPEGPKVRWAVSWIGR